MTYSPAPWEVYFNNIVDANRNCVAIEPTVNRKRLGDQYDARVAEIQDNNQLIAAAPELLEALKQVLTTHDYHTNDGAEASEYAWQIINKATGS